MTATAAKAVIDFIEEQNLHGQLRRDRRLSARQAWKSCKDKHELIGDVRGMGLMQAIELVEDRKTKAPAAAQTAQLMEAARENRPAGRQGRTLRQRDPRLAADEHRPQRTWTSSSNCSTRAWPPCSAAGGGERQVIAPVRGISSVSRICIRPSIRRRPLVEANRCLYCFDAPCTAACPTHIDVPRFIKKIATGNLRGSALTHSRRQHPGPELLARLPGGCALRRRLRDAPLQQAADRDRPAAALRDGSFLRHAATAAARRRAAAQRAGRVYRRRAGVAGLRGGTAAARRRGDHLRQPPAARRPQHLRSRGVQAARRPTACAKSSWSARMGVEFRTGAKSAADISARADLRREFDVIFLGVGLGAMERARTFPARICRA